MIPLVAGAVGGVASNILGKAVSALGVDDWLNNMISPKIKKPEAMPNNGSIFAYLEGLYNFYYMPLVPSDTDIKAVDDFFESYGYRVDRFDVPNLNVRGNFTYVKTRDAVVKCNVRQAAEQMTILLNNGCKFWTGEIGE